MDMDNLFLASTGRKLFRQTQRLTAVGTGRPTESYGRPIANCNADLFFALKNRFRYQHRLVNIIYAEFAGLRHRLYPDRYRLSGLDFGLDGLRLILS